MKHLKTYETIDDYRWNPRNLLNPKNGDYILLSGSGWNLFKNYIRVISDGTEDGWKGQGYHVEGITKNNELAKFWITKHEISRFLTPEEIEEFNIKIESDKYNL